MYADTITQPAEAYRFRTYRERVHAMTFPKQTKKPRPEPAAAPLGGVGPGADAGSKARLEKRTTARSRANRSNGNAA